MTGENGTKYVTLADDSRSHLLADGEQTVCGLPLPIHGGASWSYKLDGDTCSDCEPKTKGKKKA